MNLKRLHIVSFNNPYPANYGGAIDVFYKIIYLHKLDIELYLHLFFDDRHDVEALKPFCKEIYMYKRNRSLLGLLTALPFSVISRSSKQIYDNLVQIDAPILFEGLQSTHVLLKHNFKCKIFFRAHNIEHHYVHGLARSEKNILKKIIYQIQINKLKRYEKILDKSDVILSLSKREVDYFQRNYSPKTYYLPVFHGNNVIFKNDGNGKYALYHGDLSISDNIASANFILSLFSKLDIPLIIASNALPKSLKERIDKYSNICHIMPTNSDHLTELIRNAHVNVLYSLQATGTKLKVFYSLYNGRFCIVNDNIVDDANILKLCHVANSSNEFLQTIRKLFNEDFVYPENRDIILKQFHPANIAMQLIKIFSCGT